MQEEWTATSEVWTNNHLSENLCSDTPNVLKFLKNSEL